MTAEPRAFLAIDHGAATASVALIGHVGGAWRLVGQLALPAGGDVEAVIDLLHRRLVASAPALAVALAVGPGEGLRDAPRLEVRSQRPKRLAVVSASERGRVDLVALAERSGWRVSSASVETTDPLAMTRLLLDHGIDAFLVGAGDPPTPDERSAARELATLVAAAAGRRPEVPVVLAGAMAEGMSAFGDVSARAGEVLLGPAAGGPAVRDGESPLSELLLELAMPVDDPKRAIGPATQALADVLDRRVETIVLGHDASVRAIASPSAGGMEGLPELSVVPAAAVAPDDPDDALIDGVLVWSTVVSDRHRLRDRMRELRIAPWSDAAGEGSALRMAAARAALGRLVAATTHKTPSAPPDVVVTAGGVWSAVPAPAVALALVDVVRRPGASQFALDHARLLGPLGSIPDAGERLAVMADLVDDLLVPLGSVVTPAGLRAGRSAGTLTIHADGGKSDLELVPGGLELVDLPPGETAMAEFRFRDTVRLGTRGRHFAVDVAGGLGGLLVDLRDVPLRLPERADRRRDLLSAWQAALWAGGDA
ncbi:MAG TPA: hypothetical protein VD763_12550 [Candidatus Saccharimonadales bacterium]|nr:hypothetical protein [Candidatus Saccharimonadales bacterium]